MKQLNNEEVLRLGYDAYGYVVGRIKTTLDHVLKNKEGFYSGFIYLYYKTFFESLGHKGE